MGMSHDGSKPYLVNMKMIGKWIFIPPKMVQCGKPNAINHPQTHHFMGGIGFQSFPIGRFLALGFPHYN